MTSSHAWTSINTKSTSDFHFHKDWDRRYRNKAGYFNAIRLDDVKISVRKARRETELVAGSDGLLPVKYRRGYTVCVLVTRVRRVAPTKRAA